MAPAAQEGTTREGTIPGPRGPLARTSAVPCVTRQSTVTVIIKKLMMLAAAEVARVSIVRC